MTTFKTDDLRILEEKEVISPVKLYQKYPITERVANTVRDAREAIHRILTGEDDRLLVVAGPCSIHNPDAAREYARQLLPLRETLQDTLLIVMRIYFEKPRTTVGWKGLINDPDLDESFHINKGLGLARHLLLDINEMGIPAGTEFLDPISPQYIADLVSWGAIGARTTESQVHRELASGLSCPVGFKNSTHGGFRVAIDAIRSGAHPHHFLSVTKEGHSAIFSTTGNEDCHLILRGGIEPNYRAEDVQKAAESLKKAGLAERLMIDCSHANSNKQYERQVDVAHDIANQIAHGETRIIGMMLESHLREGRQNVIPGKKLNFGQSITDACLGWKDTESVLHHIADAVQQRRKNSS